MRDLCGWLAILANPRDEIALYGVLASPLVGASTDALALVGETGPARQGHAWQAIAEAFLTEGGSELTRRLGPEDRERLRAFAVRFQAERAVASRLGLDELLERIVAAADYDLHVLSLPTASGAWPTCTSSSGSRPSTSASTAATSARSSTSRTPSWRPRRARPTLPSSWGTFARSAS